MNAGRAIDVPESERRTANDQGPTTAFVKSFVQLVLRGYKRFISPVMLPACKFTPTCSEYAIEAVEHYGVARGLARAAWRVLRCNPFSKGGLDPVVKPNSTHICQNRADMGHPAP